MTRISITMGDFQTEARLYDEQAPKTRQLAVRQLGHGRARAPRVGGEHANIVRLESADDEHGQHGVRGDPERTIHCDLDGTLSAMSSSRAAWLASVRVSSRAAANGEGSRASQEGWDPSLRSG